MFSSFSKKNIVLSTAVVLSLGLTGCGGSSSSNTTPTKTGVFADAPVDGLSYKTATQSGFTDANGSFKYKDGETVEFKLGTLSLGKGKAGALVTPYTISDNNTTATNIAMILQNFDANRSDTQVLNLSKLKDFNFSADENTQDINLSASPSVLQNKLANVLATGSFQLKVDDTNLTLITATEVKANMDDYIQHHINNNNTITKTKKNTVDNNTTKVTNEYIEETEKTNEYIADNIMVPFMQSVTNKFSDGTIYTEKIGVIGDLKITKTLNGNSSEIHLELKDGITSMVLSDATKTDNMQGYSAFAGDFSGKIIADYTAGTEHLVFTSSKLGNADCVNTYKPIMPYQITQENSDLSGLDFDNEDMISTTCPDWVNNDSTYSGPQNFKDIQNYILVDFDAKVTEVSRLIQITN